MRFDEGFVLAELRRVIRARRLLADTSALICLETLGLLAETRRKWQLVTVAAVLDEWRRGSPEAPDLVLLPGLHGPDYPRLGTDRQLLAQSLSAGLPLLSEDRRILQATEEAGLPAVCSLWLVAGLEQSGLIGRTQSLGARQTMADRYRYDARRLGLFDQMLLFLDKGEL